MTVTVALMFVLPPAPLQVRVYVALLMRLLRTWVPDMDLEPLHPPEAVQPVVFVLDHVKVLDAL